MKKAVIFPGQGSQSPGMAKDLYGNHSQARNRFQLANDILGFEITKIMFEGTAEELTRTSVTQPAIFLHSVILAELIGNQTETVVTAGHSVGEFAAVVYAGTLSFEDGLRLVAERAAAMQEACDAQPGTMAAIVGLDDQKVAEICAEIHKTHILVPANYNSQGQLVVSGSVEGIEQILVKAKEAGAKLAKKIPVGGAFHSPLMASAQERLAKAIDSVRFSAPNFPVCQNCTAFPETDPEKIRQNLKLQLTAPVKWTQSVKNMIAVLSVSHFTEIGPGKVLQGLVKRIDESVTSESIASI